MLFKHRILSQAFLDSKQFTKRPSLFENVRRTTTATAKEDLQERAALANAKPFEEMPSFFMLPWLGTSWIYLPIIGRYSLLDQHKAAVDKRKRLGDIFKEKIGSMNLVISFNADDMETIYRHEGRYPSRGEFSSIKAYRESRKEWYGTAGVVVLQGEEWHDLRSKTQKHLMKPKAIQAYLNPMQDVARDFVTRVSTIMDSNREVPDLVEELNKWGLESIALVGLDARLGCLDLNLAEDSDGMKMIKSVKTQFDCMNKLEAVTGSMQFWKYFPTPTWRKFTKAGDTFTKIAFKYITRSLNELKNNAGNEDKDMTLLQSMLTTKGLDLSGVMVTVADMLTAGIETTSHSVGFFLYNMARNPEKQENLYQDIKRLLPRREDRITPSVLNELKYLKACIKESQRLCPILDGVTMARLIDHDVVLSGYRVPARTILTVAQQIITKDEKYFTKPDQFLPERWLDKEKKIHPFTLLPFGIGVRSCIGRRLAELEIICVITEIVRSFKVEYHYEDIGMITRLVNAPDRPMRFNFIER